MQETIQVALIEDDQEIRQLMQLIIDGSPGFACRQAFASVEEGVPALLNDPPDIVLMDINFPDISGIDGIRWLEKEKFGSSIIMLTVHEEEDAAFERFGLLTSSKSYAHF